MASNLACVGLAVEDEEAYGALIDTIVPHAARLGSRGGFDVLRWEDPSGARLVLTVTGDELVGLLPSFSAAPGARLAEVVPLGDELVRAEIHDPDGETVTAAALELEQLALLPRREALAGEASVVALGVDVEVFPDEGAFDASDRSLMGDAGDAEEPPPEIWPPEAGWPLRYGAESFVSYGLFADDSGEEPTAHAWLAGTVLHADRRRVELTRQEVVVARVRTVAFEAEVCVPGSELSVSLEPGHVIAGTVFLVGSLDVLSGSAAGDEPPRRSGLRRLFGRL